MKTKVSAFCIKCNGILEYNTISSNQNETEWKFLAERGIRTHSAWEQVSKEEGAIVVNIEISEL